MATAAIAGYKALVKTSTSSTGGTLTKIAELRDYTLTTTHDTFDATSHDSSGERERIGGITGWPLPRRRCSWMTTPASGKSLRR